MNTELSCKIQLQGAAAAVSGSQMVRWHTLPNQESVLVYASHGLLYLASPTSVALSNGICQDVLHVDTCLRTSVMEQQPPTVDPPVITAVASLDGTGLVTGWSDGRIQLWRFDVNNETWREYSVVEFNDSTNNQSSSPSITTLDATCVSSGHDEPSWFRIVTGSSQRATAYHCQYDTNTDSLTLLDTHDLSENIRTSVSTIYCCHPWIFVGTAAPRHNQIHVHVDTNNKNGDLQYAGSLLGHENWITDFSFQNNLLASASQDARIRLWKFAADSDQPLNPTLVGAAANSTGYDYDDDDDDLSVPIQEEEEGESRLEVVHNGKVTSVTLEALLYGHEESVTAVQWHPHPRRFYSTDHVLFSSSMDRQIFLWTEGEDGIWAPLSRVGSAGGILGGSIGSSLLGFCSIVLEPNVGRVLIGHAYGGALHVWNMEEEDDKDENRQAGNVVAWRAAPGITGHFRGVTDLCWEANNGDYVVSVSADQTARLWAPIHLKSSRKVVWKELVRPQVHGYNLSSVASLSTAEHPHLLVTGADEKELRAFDAPETTLRLLDGISGLAINEEDPCERVERAFIPSLGLSNKASAKDAAEQDDGIDPKKDDETPGTGSLQIPLERDLGAVLLWPEVQKLFGHNTEIFCLASSGALVASTTKARDVNDASIRLWDVAGGKCTQVLSGGHKSTVATLCFSHGGRYLASCGKDRKLCIWRRDVDGSYSLGWAKESAHKRICWSVHFCPFDAQHLVSGSRDGCVKLWTLNDSDGMEAREVCSFAPSFARMDKPDAVTALAFAPTSLPENVALLSVGLESGRIEFWGVPLNGGMPQLLPVNLQPAQCHIATITKLAWRPLGTKNNSVLLLASSSMDHSCRITEIKIK